MFVPILKQLALLLSFIVIGFLFGKLRLVDRNQSRILSVLSVDLFLPCTIFNSFAKSFTVSNLRQYSALIIPSLAILVVLILIAAPVSRLLTKEDYRRRVLHYSLIVPNFGYMGYAMAEGLFGSEGLLELILFCIPVSLYTYTVGFASLTKQKLSLKNCLNIVNLSILLGILFGVTGWTVPDTANLILSKSANCMAPVSMLLAGLVISEFDLKRLPLDFATWSACFARLLVIPITLGVLVRLTGNSLLTRSTVLTYAMPCGLNTILFPKLVGEDCSTGAALALISNLLSLATIPLCMALV